MLFRKKHPTPQLGIQPNAIFNVYAEVGPRLREPAPGASRSGDISMTSRVPGCTERRSRPQGCTQTRNHTLGHFLWQRLSQARSTG
jgi:hypothetical protein